MFKVFKTFKLFKMFKMMGDRIGRQYQLERAERSIILNSLNAVNGHLTAWIVVTFGSTNWIESPTMASVEMNCT